MAAHLFLGVTSTLTRRCGQSMSATACGASWTSFPGSQ
jgi:hypothetical protein